MTFFVTNILLAIVLDHYTEARRRAEGKYLNDGLSSRFRSILLVFLPPATVQKIMAAVRPGRRRSTTSSQQSTAPSGLSSLSAPLCAEAMVVPSSGRGDVGVDGGAGSEERARLERLEMLVEELIREIRGG